LPSGAFLKTLFSRATGKSRKEIVTIFKRDNSVIFHDRKKYQILKYIKDLAFDKLN
jgi:hypothetical protein